MAKSIKEWNFCHHIIFLACLLVFVLFLISISKLWSNDVQIPLWNSALAKSPVSEYPPNWPAQWMHPLDGQKSPSIPVGPTVGHA